MESVCVRVPHERGEETRQHLADEGVLDQDLRIEGEQGFLYIPVEKEPEGLDLPVERREFEERETEVDASDLSDADRADAARDVLGLRD